MVENRPWLSVLSHLVLSIGVLVTAPPIWIHVSSPRRIRWRR